MLLRHELQPADERQGSDRRLHWDLMLEQGGALKTWALAERPVPGLTISAEALDDHRLHYLTYEGPISGNRGVVFREDAGAWLPSVQEGPRWEFHILGQWLRGCVCLSQVAGRSWRFVWRDVPTAADRM